MSKQDFTMVEVVKDTAYDFFLYLMITLTAIMAGYTSCHFFQKESYFASVAWGVVTLAVIFQVPLWRFAFSKTD